MSGGDRKGEYEKKMGKKRKNSPGSLENCPLWGPMFVNDVGLNARVQPRLFSSVFPGFPDFFF